MGFDYTQTFPGGGAANNENTLRINIRAFRTLKQNLNPKLGNHIVTGEELYSWSMIAPTDIQENVSHAWEEYHSIQGRASEVRRDVVNSAKKLGSLGSGVTTSSSNVSSGNVIVDSPMVYTGSERREYSFTFPMMIYTSTGSTDVADPINKFKRLSCASIDDVSADTIEFPAVFRVETWPLPFIYVENAALTNVQTVYNSPYRAGTPQRAELTLTFKDIKPLYTSSWEKEIYNKIIVGQI